MALVLVEAVVDDLRLAVAHHVVALDAVVEVHGQPGVLVTVADHPTAVRRHG